MGRTSRYLTEAQKQWNEQLAEWKRKLKEGELEYSASEAERIIAEYIHDEKARPIIRRRLLDKPSIEKLAEEADLSVQGVKTILHDCEIIVFKHLFG